MQEPYTRSCPWQCVLGAVKSSTYFTLRWAALEIVETSLRVRTLSVTVLGFIRELGRTQLVSIPFSPAGSVSPVLTAKRTEQSHNTLPNLVTHPPRLLKPSPAASARFIHHVHLLLLFVFSAPPPSTHPAFFNDQRPTTHYLPVARDPYISTPTPFTSALAMADIEKQANGHTNGQGAPSTSNTLTNVAGAGRWPLGADPGGQYPYTLGANALQQQLYQGGVPSFRKFANPAPLGLLSFASTTFILSLVNVSTDGVTVPNVVVGMALFVGGLCQLLAGMWEFAAGNTLGATGGVFCSMLFCRMPLAMPFSSYGGFWMSFATIYIPNSGIIAAYSDPVELNHAVGFYLAVWFIFTFIMFIASLRSNSGLITLFFFLDLTFMFLTIGSFVTNPKITSAGGGFGIITAFIAYYCGCANMLSRESSFFTLPLYPIPGPKSD
ncbi:hypothetical protein EW145_g5343 [Phellinidium pouzarii]|uniref:Uncharacterized protein n=1 Tax=Phellinidium pouzarii TaxID=167371 RepID=A0A4S4L0V3_9AGAM|nr:hypothetical protein EW145_g5343 [Phellinidium pouzarii]